MDTLVLDRMLVLFAQGSFTATYKYAQVLAFISLCVQELCVRDLHCLQLMKDAHDMWGREIEAVHGPPFVMEHGARDGQLRRGLPDEADNVE